MSEDYSSLLSACESVVREPWDTENGVDALLVPYWAKVVTESVGVDPFVEVLIIVEVSE